MQNLNRWEIHSHESDQSLMCLLVSQLKQNENNLYLSNLKSRLSV